MKIHVNKCHFPVTTLGYGQRVGIWLQGCSIRCPGCLSRDTWETLPETAITVDELTRSVTPWLETADGVTISGGEPFDQARTLASLVRHLRKQTPGDVLVYSGYPMEFLRRHFPKTVALLDVLITDPYRPDAGQTLILRGSDNQRIFLLSDLARRRYPADINEQPWSDTRRLDVIVEGAEVWIAGIPRPDDLHALRVKLEGTGYSMRMSDETMAPAHCRQPVGSGADPQR